MPQNPSGELLTGQMRTRQSPLFDSIAVATTTALAASYKMFGNVSGTTANPEITNMQQSFKLPGLNKFKVQSLRCVFHAAAADITSFCKLYTVRLKVAGILQLEAPADYWPGGAGVSTAASNGINDPRAVIGFDLDPILITDDMNFFVEAITGGTPFTTTAAFFMRVYLDGRLWEPA